MDLQQLFAMLPQDAGLAGDFGSAIAAGKDVLEKFLKDHDINAAVEEVVKYVQEHAADLAGIIPGDLLGNIGNLVSGVVPEGVAEAVSDAVSGAVPEGVADAVSDVVSDVASGKTGGILEKIKSFFTGK